MKLVHWIAGAAILLILTETGPRWAGWLLLLIVLYMLLRYGV